MERIEKLMEMLGTKKGENMLGTIFGEVFEEMLAEDPELKGKIEDLKKGIEQIEKFKNKELGKSRVLVIECENEMALTNVSNCLNSHGYKDVLGGSYDLVEQNKTMNNNAYPCYVSNPSKEPIFVVGTTEESFGIVGMMTMIQGRLDTLVEFSFWLDQMKNPNFVDDSELGKHIEKAFKATSQVQDICQCDECRAARGEELIRNRYLLVVEIDGKKKVNSFVESNADLFDADALDDYIGKLKEEYKSNDIVILNIVEMN